jgi:protein-S-isoprenylcysteine O-methyltransferase Ste14
VGENAFYWIVLAAWFAAGVAAMLGLLWKTAPYGRFTRAGWGPLVSPQLAWLLMEGPAAVVFTLLFLAGTNRGPAAVAFLLIWDIHYVYRGFVYPCLKRSDRGVPVSIVLAAFCFQLINPYLQARYLFSVAPEYPVAWLWDSRFLAGTILFAIGWVVTVQSDAILRSLRAGGDRQYHIPRGGLFRWVSCPNYFGELLEWSAWALLTWSLPGAVFAFWTAANLVPRALAYHRWYREEFPDYPSGRKAVVPWVL